LANQKFATGWPLAERWQDANGPLEAGHRLVPQIPFVLGGDFSAENLYSADDVVALRFRADIAKQIRDLPDGAKVRLRVGKAQTQSKS
jgi:hypothetical protein